jgi:5-methylcytosine-specific restriction protein A
MKRTLFRRSDDLYYIAYALSRLSGPEGEPPAILGVSSWAEAYDLFFVDYGGGREIKTFRNSLKNLRDAFDAFHDDGPRRGWRSATGEPPTEGPSRVNKFRVRLDPLSDGEVEVLLEAGPSASDPLAKEGRAYTEGGEKVYVSRRRERASGAREAAIAEHGLNCQGCGFNFEDVYGPHGAGFIEVHHAQMLGEGGIRETDPVSDLNVLCSNCPRMVHRKRFQVLSLSELVRKICTHQVNSEE